MTGFLLDQGMDVEEIGTLGSPLRCAALNGHNDACRLLLTRGAAVHGNGRLGSVLHAAAMKDHLHTAKLLAESGADVNIRGGYFGTPLQAAAYHGHEEIVALLIARKSNPDLSGFSKDAFHAAAHYQGPTDFRSQTVLSYFIPYRAFQ
jgi:ankyrin repeat protein